MKRNIWIAVCMASAAILISAMACAWEVEYNAGTGVLPTAASPAWQLFIHGDPTPTISDGVLHIQHIAAANYVEYGREGWAIDAGIPVTMEARMRVGETSGGTSRLSIQTKGCYADFLIHSDHLSAYDWNNGWIPITFGGDFTIYRTMRFAYDGGSRAYVWVDDQMAFKFGLAPTNGQDGVNFGSYMGAGSCDSYWQYVAYSKEFLPVPEPSSLAAILGLSLLAAGGVLEKRRR